MKFTVKQVKQNINKAVTGLGQVNYKIKKYDLLNKDNVRLATLEDLNELNTDLLLSGTYYDNCFIQVRKNDIYLADNTRCNNACYILG